MYNISDDELDYINSDDNDFDDDWKETLQLDEEMRMRSLPDHGELEMWEDVKSYADIIAEIQEKIDIRDLQINPVQFEKLVKVCEFFERMTATNEEEGLKSAVLQPVELKPKWFDGFVEILCKPSFSLSGRDLQELSEISKYCDAFEVTCSTDGTIDVSFSVARIYEPKE